MKINNIDVLVSSIEERINSKTNATYWVIGILDLTDGTNFNLMVKDQDTVMKVKAMNKYVVSLSLQDSQYGMRLSFTDIAQDLGGILG